MDVKVKAIRDLAINNPLGFTIRLNDLSFVTSGFICAYAATQNCFDDEGLRKCIEHADANAGIVGGWYNSENGKFYYDSSRVFDCKTEALEFAKLNNQIAIFDLYELKEIRL